MNNGGVRYFVDGVEATVEDGYVEVPPNGRVVIRQVVTFPARTWDVGTYQGYSNGYKDRRVDVRISDGFDVRVVAKNDETDTSVLDSMPGIIEEFDGDNPTLVSNW